MKKWDSRFLSILLSLCMVIGSFSMPVYANEAEAGMEVAEATVDETVVTDEDVTTEEAVTMVETSEVETSEVETEESVSAVETEAVTEVETQEELELAALQTGDKIHIKFTGDNWWVKINGKTGVSSMDVEVSVGTGKASFSIPMEAADGYLITSLESNLSTGFMSSETVPVMYRSESNTAQMQFDSNSYIPDNTIEIKISAVETTHFMLTFEGSTNLPKACLENMVIKYLWDAGDDNHGGNYVDSNGGIHLGEYNTFDVYVPSNSQFVITEITDGDDHNLNDFIFWYADRGQRTEKVTTTYNGPYDDYTGLPMIVANKGNIHIVITKKDVEPKNTYTVSCSGAEHAYIGTSANPSTRSFSTEVAKGKALDVYVKCEEGYAIKGISSVSGSASFEKGIEGLNTDNYKFTIPADRIEADTVITVTTMVKKATVSSNGGNFKIRPVADDTWYNSIPGEYVGRETPFTFVVKPNTGNVITKVSYKTGETDTDLTAADGGNDTDGYTYTIPAGLTKDARITVVTAQAFDLSKAVVKMYFDGSLRAGNVASYSKVAALSEDGIVPTKVEVNDTKGKALAESEYEISYIGNDVAGPAFLVLTAKEGSKVYSGRKEVPFTIKGTSITDAKKVKINVVAPTSWDNSEDGLGNEALIEIYDISGTEPVKLTEAKMSPMGNTAGDYVVKYNGDYDYKDNCVKPGALSVDIVGVGGYEGTKTYKYTVAKPTFNKATETGENDTIKVELMTKSYDFTGRAITPEPVVTYKDKTLVKGKDYVIKKYTNNINSYTLGAGDEGFKATKAPSILIQGIGYYQGTKTVNFKINKANTDWVSFFSFPADESYKYTGSEIKPKVSVKYCDEEYNVLKKYVEKVDYTLEYSNNIQPSFNEAVVKVIPTANGGLTGDPFEITFSIADVKNNIADAKRFKVQFIKGGVPVDNYSVDYNGEVQEPQMQITEIGGNPDGSDKILDSSNFGYSFPDASTVGRAKITIYGAGDYYGKVSKYFTINKRVVDKVTLNNIRVTIGNDDAQFYANEQTKIPEYEYTGYAIKPKIELVGYGSMTEGVDYTISYSNNTNVSTDTKLATATIKFKGGYTGVAADKTNSFVIKYKINSWDLGAADEIVVNNGNNIVYTGKDIKPSVAVTTPNGEAVNPKVLKFVYKNNLNAAASDSDNAPTVRIMPVNKNLTAPKINEKESYVEENFAIEKAELSTSVTVAKIPTQTYKGKALTPKLTLKYNGKVLKEGQDYNCFYSNNTSRGTGWISVTVPENSNYYTESGYSMFVSFTIK